MTESDQTIPVTVTHRFDASAERVYDAFLDPAKAGLFLFATATGQIVRCDIDARVGGTFTIVDRRQGEDVVHRGQFLELDRPRRIVFTFSVEKYGNSVDRVSIDIMPLQRGCDLTLTHEMHAEYARFESRVRQGWIDILDVAATVVTAEAPTCGVGIAQHAAIPMKIGIMFEGLAETLELHRRMLVPGDGSRHEDEVYRELAEHWRSIAAEVQRAATQMAGQRDLPMAEHDESAWSEAHLRAFEKFVRSQTQLLALLRAAAPHDEQMLASMMPPS